MKQIYTLFYLLFLFLVSCASNETAPYTDYSYENPISITLTEEHFLGDPDVLLSDEHGIVTLDIDRDRPGWDIVNTTMDGVKHILYSFHYASFRWPAQAYDRHGNKYFAIVIHGENYSEKFGIVRLNISSDLPRKVEHEIIQKSEWDIFINFFIEDDAMIILDHRNVGDNREIDIVKLDLSDNTKQVIITKTFSLQSPY